MTSRSRRQSITRSTLVGLAAVALFSLSGCTSTGDDRPAVVTLPENNTTTLPPSTLAPGDAGPAGPTEAPEVSWVVQVGGTGDDEFKAVTGAGSDVVATGTTASGVDAPSAGGTDVLTARVNSEGEVTKLSQFGSELNDSALAITNLGSQTRPADNGVIPDGAAPDGSVPDGTGGSQPDAQTEAAPVACGSTQGTLGTQMFGGSDGWCGPAESANRQTTTPGTQPGTEPGTRPGIQFGAIPGIIQMGGDRNDSITGVSPAGSATRSSDAPSGVLYMSGSTDGFYPGAEDPAGQGLGAGDALAFRMKADGELSWIRQFGTQAADAALGVCAVGSEAFYAGWTEGSLSGPSKGGRDAWISFIDASGIQRWITQFGSAGNDQFNAIANAGDAARGTMQLVAVGSSTGDVDSEGPAMNAGGADAIVAAFAPDGSTMWSKQFGSGLDDSAAGVVVDGSTIYVTGTTTSEPTPAEAGAPTTTAPGTGAPGTPGAGDPPATTKPPVQGIGDLDTSVGKGGGTDAFLAALDAQTGEILWITRLGSEKDEAVTGISTTGNGLLVISGKTTGQLGKSAPGGGTDAFLIAFPLPAAGGAAASSV